MKRRRKAAGILGICIILCAGMTGCSKKAGDETKQTVRQSLEESVESVMSEESSVAEEKNGTEESISAEHDSGSQAERETEKSGEGRFYDGANLSGRVMEFSDTELVISPSTLIINEDGSMEGGSPAPGYESEEDFITVTYTEGATFQIIKFSMASQTESSREDTDKSSIKKGTEVNIFGTSQDEKRWTADKVVITVWQ